MVVTCIARSKNIISFLSKNVIARCCSNASYYYITSPIFYANAKPHIGHLYTALIADALQRYQQLKLHGNVYFMTGTDEHGLKIYQAAKKCNSPTGVYVEHVSKMYRDLFNLYQIEYSDFLRTTEKRHKDCVISMWNKLAEKDLIYKSEYSGWYCVADEAFIPELQLYTGPDGVKRTVDGNRTVDFVREENYKFRLSAFKSQLLEWLKKDVVRPAKFQKILTTWIENGDVLEDISVSRPRSRVPWGIPVPGDPDHCIYVWLDALSCYLTSAGYPKNLQNWPPSLQVIGKDILKFHGVYWPAFLMGADLRPPVQLLCHSHWVINGEKMSKSRGNVIDPVSEAQSYTSEGFRYFLLREGVPHSDGNYSNTKVQRILNSELADTLGNLLNRCTGILVNPRQVFPSFSAESHKKFCHEDGKALLLAVENLPHAVNEHYDNFDLYKGIEAIFGTLRLANEFFERKKPWELRKHQEHLDELSAVIHLTMETLRVCGVLLSPIVPTLSKLLLNKLNIPEQRRNLSSISEQTWKKGESVEHKLSPDKVTLFVKVK